MCRLYTGVYIPCAPRFFLSKFSISLLIDGRAIMCLKSCLPAFSIGKPWGAHRSSSSSPSPFLNWYKGGEEWNFIHPCHIKTRKNNFWGSVPISHIYDYKSFAHTRVTLVQKTRLILHYVSCLVHCNTIGDNYICNNYVVLPNLQMYILKIYILNHTYTSKHICVIFSFLVIHLFFFSFNLLQNH